MSIEEEIRQSTFKSEYHRLIVNLMYTNNWLCDSQMRMLKPFGLTIQQYNVLRILRGQSQCPVKVSDITERMLDKMSNASRLVDKLVAKELVQRTECPHDRRAVDVVILASGLTLLDRIDVAMAQWEESMRDLADGDAAQLSRLLDQLRHTIRQSEVETGVY
jgi:DNA-binding MarR family transcriptional regulator